jgi:hypothetical protein
MHERGGTVEIHNANSTVRKLITVVGMDQVVDLKVVE